MLVGSGIYCDAFSVLYVMVTDARQGSYFFDQVNIFLSKGMCQHAGYTRRTLLITPILVLLRSFKNRLNFPLNPYNYQMF
jgi:hypothetical protein